METKCCYYLLQTLVYNFLKFANSPMHHNIKALKNFHLYANNKFFKDALEYFLCVLDILVKTSTTI